MNMTTEQMFSKKKLMSQIVSTSGAIGFVVAVAVLSFVGTTSAVAALNRNAANEIASVQRANGNRKPPIPPDFPDTSSDSNSSGQVPTPSDDHSDITSELSQLDWAKQYGIRWDEGGNPIDKSGNVMNDPTTSVNEVARAIANGSATADGVSVYWLGQQEAVEPPKEVSQDTKLYENVENVSQLSDGTYIYTVQRGDCLTHIGSTVGVDLPTLIELNQLANPSLIEIGQQMRLPSLEVITDAGGVGLG